MMVTLKGLPDELRVYRVLLINQQRSCIVDVVPNSSADIFSLLVNEVEPRPKVR